MDNKTTEVQAMHGAGKIVRDLLGGTRRMRECGEEYLPRFSFMPPEMHKNVIEKATLYPALSETLKAMTGRVFFRGVDTGNVNADAITALFADMDLRNHDLNTIAADWFEDALAFGVSYMLVDYHNAPAARTRQDDAALGLRPYCVPIKNSQVLGWKTATVGGREVLSEFRFIQEWLDENGNTIRQITVWEIGRVSTYRQTPSGWQQHSETGVSANGKPLTRIPIVALQLEGAGLLGGRPPLADLAYLNVKHWQAQADYDNLVHYVSQPLLVGTGFELAGRDEVFQTGNNLITLPKDATLRYVEHGGSAIAAASEKIAKIEADMATAGAKLLQKAAMAMTESQAIDERGKEVSRLRVMANRCEDAIGQMLDCFGLWLGFAPEQVGTVEISGNIDVETNPAAGFAEILKLHTAGIISTQTAFDEAKRRGLLSETVGWDDELMRLNGQEQRNGFDYPPN